MTSGWIPLSEAAKRIGFASPKWALRRLARLERLSKERVLRRVGGRWEVSLAALERANSEADPRLEDLVERQRVAEERIDSLRTVGAKFRRETREKFEKHADAIKKVSQANKAATAALAAALDL